MQTTLTLPAYDYSDTFASWSLGPDDLFSYEGEVYVNHAYKHLESQESIISIFARNYATNMFHDLRCVKTKMRPVTIENDPQYFL